jgi:hypothetical protein
VCGSKKPFTLTPPEPSLLGEGFFLFINELSFPFSLGEGGLRVRAKSGKKAVHTLITDYLFFYLIFFFILA